MSKSFRGKSTILSINQLLHVELFGVVLFSLESFETEDEDFGGFVDLHLFFGQDKVFAFGAVPGVFLAKNLRLFEEFETVFNGGSGLFFTLLLLTFVSIGLDIL